VIHYGDICALCGADLEPVDCIIGGSPCQGLSHAGKRKGLDDERSPGYSWSRSGSSKNYARRISSVEGQVSLFAPDTPCGRTSPAPSAQANRKGKISGLSSKNSRVLRTLPPMCLDLRKGSGGLLGPYWEMDGAWLGGSWTLNSSECPNAVVESRLSAILEANPPMRYYLSAKACLGILRRAEKRGKELPKILARALMWQIEWMSRTAQPGRP